MTTTDRLDRVPQLSDGYAVIEALQLTRSYGRRVGVRAIDLRITAGQIFGFLGPNGAGKTTTIRLLLGFLRASAGSATIFGRDCWRQRARILQDVGYLPGDLRLYSWLTGQRALRISQQIRGQDVTSVGRELCGLFRLEMNLRVRQMSRGMRQKLGLVLALAHRPRLLVLDEPTSGLDPLMQSILMDLLRERAAQGTTIFFSSHTLSEVEQLCDRIAIVRDGEIVVDDSLEVLRRKAQRAVKLLFSDEADAQQIPTPPFLMLTSRLGRRWHGELAGPPAALIDWASTLNLEDLEIGPPSLESLFRSYYCLPEEPA
jgi:ABC-2 type transport system ATP-binding protein